MKSYLFALLAPGTLIFQVSFLAVGCTSAPRPNVNSGGATALLKDASRITSIQVVDLDTRDSLYQLSHFERDTLLTSIENGFVSTSLQVTGQSWNIALEMKIDSNLSFVAMPHYYVLRVNPRRPYSASLRDVHDSTQLFDKEIADIHLPLEGGSWLFHFLERIMGTPPSTEYRFPTPPAIHRN